MKKEILTIMYLNIILLLGISQAQSTLTITGNSLNLQGQTVNAPQAFIPQAHVSQQVGNFDQCTISLLSLLDNDPLFFNIKVQSLITLITQVACDGTQNPNDVLNLINLTLSFKKAYDPTSMILEAVYVKDIDLENNAISNSRMDIRYANLDIVSIDPQNHQATIKVQTIGYYAIRIIQSLQIVGTPVSNEVSPTALIPYLNPAYSLNPTITSIDPSNPTVSSIPSQIYNNFVTNVIHLSFTTTQTPLPSYPIQITIGLKDYANDIYNDYQVCQVLLDTSNKVSSITNVMSNVVSYNLTQKIITISVFKDGYYVVKKTQKIQSYSTTVNLAAQTLTTEAYVPYTHPAIINGNTPQINITSQFDWQNTLLRDIATPIVKLSYTGDTTGFPDQNNLVTIKLPLLDVYNNQLIYYAVNISSDGSIQKNTATGLQQMVITAILSAENTILIQVPQAGSYAIQKIKDYRSINYSGLQYYVPTTQGGMPSLTKTNINTNNFANKQLLLTSALYIKLGVFLPTYTSPIGISFSLMKNVNGRPLKVVIIDQQGQSSSCTSCQIIYVDDINKIITFTATSQIALLSGYAVILDQNTSPLVNFIYAPTTAVVPYQHESLNSALSLKISNYADDPSNSITNQFISKITSLTFIDQSNSVQQSNDYTNLITLTVALSQTIDIFSQQLNAVQIIDGQIQNQQFQVTCDPITKQKAYIKVPGTGSYGVQLNTLNSIVVFDAQHNIIAYTFVASSTQIGQSSITSNLNSPEGILIEISSLTESSLQIFIKPTTVTQSFNINNYLLYAYEIDLSGQKVSNSNSVDQNAWIYTDQYYQDWIVITVYQNGFFQVNKDYVKGISTQPTNNLGYTDFPANSILNVYKVNDGSNPNVYAQYLDNTTMPDTSQNIYKQNTLLTPRIKVTADSGLIGAIILEVSLRQNSLNLWALPLSTLSVISLPLSSTDSTKYTYIKGTYQFSVISVTQTTAKIQVSTAGIYAITIADNYNPVIQAFQNSQNFLFPLINLPLGTGDVLSVSEVDSSTSVNYSGSLASTQIVTVQCSNTESISCATSSFPEQNLILIIKLKASACFQGTKFQVVDVQQNLIYNAATIILQDLVQQIVVLSIINPGAYAIFQQNFLVTGDTTLSITDSRSYVTVPIVASSLSVTKSLKFDKTLASDIYSVSYIDSSQIGNITTLQVSTLFEKPSSYILYPVQINNDGVTYAPNSQISLIEISDMAITFAVNNTGKYAIKMDNTNKILSLDSLVDILIPFKHPQLSTAAITTSAPTSTQTNLVTKIANISGVNTDLVHLIGVKFYIISGSCQLPLNNFQAVWIDSNGVVQSSTTVGTAYQQLQLLSCTYESQTSSYFTLLISGPGSYAIRQNTFPINSTSSSAQTLQARFTYSSSRTNGATGFSSINIRESLISVYTKIGNSLSQAYQIPQPTADVGSTTYPYHLEIPLNFQIDQFTQRLVAYIFQSKNTPSTLPITSYNVSHVMFDSLIAGSFYIGFISVQSFGDQYTGKVSIPLSHTAIINKYKVSINQISHSLPQLVTQAIQVEFFNILNVVQNIQDSKNLIELFIPLPSNFNQDNYQGYVMQLVILRQNDTIQTYQTSTLGFQFFDLQSGFAHAIVERNGIYAVQAVDTIIKIKGVPIYIPEINIAAPTGIDAGNTGQTNFLVFQQQFDSLWPNTLTNHLASSIVNVNLNKSAPQTAGYQTTVTINFSLKNILQDQINYAYAAASINTQTQYSLTYGNIITSTSSVYNILTIPKKGLTKVSMNFLTTVSSSVQSYGYFAIVIVPTIIINDSNLNVAFGSSAYIPDNYEALSDLKYKIIVYSNGSTLSQLKTNVTTLTYINTTDQSTPNLQNTNALVRLKLKLLTPIDVFNQPLAVWIDSTSNSDVIQNDTSVAGYNQLDVLEYDNEWVTIVVSGPGKYAVIQQPSIITIDALTQIPKGTVEQQLQTILISSLNALPNKTTNQFCGYNSSNLCNGPLCGSCNNSRVQYTGCQCKDGYGGFFCLDLNIVDVQRQYIQKLSNLKNLKGQYLNQRLQVLQSLLLFASPSNNEVDSVFTSLNSILLSASDIFNQEINVNIAKLYSAMANAYVLNTNNKTTLDQFPSLRANLTNRAYNYLYHSISYQPQMNLTIPQASFTIFYAQHYLFYLDSDTISVQGTTIINQVTTIQPPRLTLNSNHKVVLLDGKVYLSQFANILFSDIDLGTDTQMTAFVQVYFSDFIGQYAIFDPIQDFQVQLQLITPNIWSHEQYNFTVLQVIDNKLVTAQAQVTYADSNYINFTTVNPGTYVVVRNNRINYEYVAPSIKGNTYPNAYVLIPVGYASSASPSNLLISKPNLLINSSAKLATWAVTLITQSTTSDDQNLMLLKLPLIKAAQSGEIYQPVWIDSNNEIQTSTSGANQYNLSIVHVDDLYITITTNSPGTFAVQIIITNLIPVGKLIYNQYMTAYPTPTFITQTLAEPENTNAFKQAKVDSIIRNLNNLTLDAEIQRYQAFLLDSQMNIFLDTQNLTFEAKIFQLNPSLASSLTLQQINELVDNIDFVYDYVNSFPNGKTTPPNDQPNVSPDILTVLQIWNSLNFTQSDPFAIYGTYRNVMDDIDWKIVSYAQMIDPIQQSLFARKAFSAYKSQVEPSEGWQCNIYQQIGSIAKNNTTLANQFASVNNSTTLESVINNMNVSQKVFTPFEQYTDPQNFYDPIQNAQNLMAASGYQPANTIAFNNARRVLEESSDPLLLIAEETIQSLFPNNILNWQYDDQVQTLVIDQNTQYNDNTITLISDSLQKLTSLIANDLNGLAIILQYTIQNPDTNDTVGYIPFILRKDYTVSRGSQTLGVYPNSTETTTQAINLTDLTNYWVKFQPDNQTLLVGTIAEFISGTNQVYNLNSSQNGVSVQFPVHIGSQPIVMLIYKYVPPTSSELLASYTYNYFTVVYRSKKYGNCFNLGKMNPLDFIGSTLTPLEGEYLIQSFVQTYQQIPASQFDLCGFLTTCNGNGNCTLNQNLNRNTCVCESGFYGQYCDTLQSIEDQQYFTEKQITKLFRLPPDQFIDQIYNVQALNSLLSVSQSNLEMTKQAILFILNQDISEDKNPSQALLETVQSISQVQLLTLDFTDDSLVHQAYQGIRDLIQQISYFNFKTVLSTNFGTPVKLDTSGVTTLFQSIFNETIDVITFQGVSINIPANSSLFDTVSYIQIISQTNQNYPDIDTISLVTLLTEVIFYDSNLNNVYGADGYDYQTPFNITLDLEEGVDTSLYSFDPIWINQDDGSIKNSTNIPAYRSLKYISSNSQSVTFQVNGQGIYGVRLKALPLPTPKLPSTIQATTQKTTQATIQATTQASTQESTPTVQNATATDDNTSFAKYLCVYLTIILVTEFL